MTRRPSALHGRENFEYGVTPDRRKQRCLVKVVVDKNMPSFSGPGYFVNGQTPDICVLCGTNHGYDKQAKPVRFGWYYCDDGNPSADQCHRWAHEDGLCYCDELRGGR